jgi:hypothetical protein
MRGKNGEEGMEEREEKGSEIGAVKVGLELAVTASYSFGFLFHCLSRFGYFRMERYPFKKGII